jgi:hypothetical protein
MTQRVPEISETSKHARLSGDEIFRIFCGSTSPPAIQEKPHVAVLREPDIFSWHWATVWPPQHEEQLH